jgi:hypothetical protein
MRAYEERGWFTKALMLDALDLLGPPRGVGSVRVSPEIVSTLFSANTGVQFDWQRYLSERWSTRLAWATRAQIDSRSAAVPTLYAPWYQAPDGGWVDFGDLDRVPDATVIVLAELDIDTLPVDRAHNIRLIGSSLRSGSRLPVIPVLGYSVGENSCVLLDGNHRVSALLQTPGDFCLELYVIDGPKDPLALADLKFWTRKN